MRQWIARAVVPVFFASLIACGGGSGGAKSAPDSDSPTSVSSTSSLNSSSLISSEPTTSSASSDIATSAQPSSTSSISSSESSSSSSFSSTSNSSSSSVAPQAYTLVVDMPQLAQVMLAGRAKSQGPAYSFSLVTIDDQGVIQAVTRLDDEASQHSDGSWTLMLATEPRLDQLVVVQARGALEPTLGQNFSALDDAIFSPLTDNIVNVSLASTAGFSAYVESMREAGLSLTEGNMASDSVNRAALQSFFEVAKDAIDSAPAASISAALADALQQVGDLARAAVENLSNRVDSSVNGLAAALANGGIYWMDAYEADEIEYGGVSALDEEELYFELTDSGWVKQEETADELVLNPETGEWLLTGDRWRASEVRDDGSVVLSDVALPTYAEVVRATQVENLAGRSIARFYSTERDSRVLSELVSPEALFAEGALAFRAEILIAKDYYRLWHSEPEADGLCYGDTYSPTGETLNGNCAALNGNWVTRDEWGNTLSSYQFFYSTLEELFVTSDSESGLGNFLSIGWTQEKTFAAQLIDDEAKTVKFYVRYHVIDGHSYEEFSNYVGEATWAELSLPGAPEQRAISIRIPQALINMGYVDRSDRNVLLTVQNGVVRRGSFGFAGDIESNNQLLLNAAANKSLLEALAQ